MGQRFRLFLTVMGVVVIAAPLSIVITILLFPFWSWLEASTGVESVGHSGPAVWCYATVFLILATISAVVVFIRHRVTELP
jgi:hypothetical protein